MNKIIVPKSGYNYIEVYLTFDCNLNCPYCVAKDTLILTPTGFIPIKDIKVGDKVIGFEENTEKTKHHKLCITTVKKVFKRKDTTYRIRTKTTYLDITKEHLVLCRSRGWKKSEKITINDNIRHIISPFKINLNYGTKYKIGYLKGVIEGDGCFQIGHKFKQLGRIYKQYSISLRMWDDEPLKRANEYINDIFGFKLKEFSHRIDAHDKKRTMAIYKKIKYKLSKNKFTKEEAAGYLAGIFDAEGSFSKQILRICNTCPEILTNIKIAFDTLNFKYVEERFPSHIPTIRLAGRVKEKIRFFWLCNPSIQRKRNKLFNISIPNSEKVLSIKVKTLEDVYNLETESNTYIANGLCVHNCINKTYGKVNHYKSLSSADWIKGLSRLDTNDIPLTFGGGEPTIHKDFYKIVNGIDKPMDLLTNGLFDKKEFMANVSAKKFKRYAPYASIRFSYHSGITPLFPMLRKARAMNKRGYEIGIWAVDYPSCINDLIFARQVAEADFGLDFRFKDFLGIYKGKLYGTYKYPAAVDGKRKLCKCKPSEMLIAPNGNLYRCHYDLYNNVNSYGNILDRTIKIPDGYSKCDNYGLCSPCDAKGPKYDRFQKPGFCSVTIK